MAKKTHHTYYSAYGSNLNLEQMKYRCPQAVTIGTTTLEGWRLVFRGVWGNTHATIERAEGYTVPVLVWQITPHDEAVLDSYEGVPSYYTKEYFVLNINGESCTALVYIMTDGNQLGMPSEHYYKIIEDGYTQADFDHSVLATALKSSIPANHFHPTQ